MLLLVCISLLFLSRLSTTPTSKISGPHAFHCASHALDTEFIKMTLLSWAVVPQHVVKKNVLRTISFFVSLSCKLSQIQVTTWTKISQKCCPSFQFAEWTTFKEKTYHEEISNPVSILLCCNFCSTDVATSHPGNAPDGWAMKSMKGWQQMGAILEKSGVWIKNIEVAKKNMTFARLLVEVSFVLSYSFLFFNAWGYTKGGYLRPQFDRNTLMNRYHLLILVAKKSDSTINIHHQPNTYSVSTSSNIIACCSAIGILSDYFLALHPFTFHPNLEVKLNHPTGGNHSYHPPNLHHCQRSKQHCNTPHSFLNFAHKLTLRAAW